MEALLWQAITSSPGVWLGKSMHKPFLREFATVDLPEVLEPMYDQLVSLETLMKAQWLVATEMAAQTKNKKHELIAKSLSQYKHATDFLEALGNTPEGYFRQMNGLTDSEFTAMKAGELYIWQLLQENPIVFLAPVLPSNKYQIN